MRILLKLGRRTLLVMAALVFGRESVEAGGIVLQHPLEYRVHQRIEPGTGTVLVHGRADLDAEVWEYRFLGQSADGRMLGDAWLQFPTALQNGKFDFQATVPAGGWYRLEVRALKSGEPVGQAVVEHVAVGEVFVAAGPDWEDSGPRSGPGAGAVFDGKRWNPVPAVLSDKASGWVPAWTDQIGVPVGWVPVPGGEVSGWRSEESGSARRRLLGCLDALGQRGVLAVLWQGGEGREWAWVWEELAEQARRRIGAGMGWLVLDPAGAEARRLWEKGVIQSGPGAAAGWPGLVREWMVEAFNPAGGPPRPGYHLVWSDEFDGANLDLKKWKHRYPGPRKNGFNTPEAVRLDGNGHLELSCDRAPDGRYLVGMICTEGLFEAQYGYFEARVQFQTQEGWWPGFWLMGSHVADPGRGKGRVDDTSRNGTEVDVFEYLRRHGDEIQHALHWNGYGSDHKSRGEHVGVPGLGSGFHTVGVEWTPDGYRFFVDGRLTWSTREAVSQVAEYLILSGEVSEWPGDIRRAQLPDRVVFDWVRVWQLPPGEE